MRNPGVLKIENHWHAPLPSDPPSHQHRIIRGPSNQNSVRLIPFHFISNSSSQMKVTAQPYVPSNAEEAAEGDRDGTCSDDSDLRRNQTCELGVKAFDVMLRINTNNSRLPALCR